MANLFSAESQDLVEISEYHRDAIEALVFFLRSLAHQSDARFLGFTPSEFNDLLRTRIEETELRSSLAILAAMEAAFRIDYRFRVKKRLKDPLSREFRAMHRKRQEQVRLKEDLLGLWILHHPTQKNLIQAFRDWIPYRHWLAHGRHWNRPTDRRFDYPTLYLLADSLFAQLPLLRA